MNAAQALKYQVELANTAHQREVADLQAAGLNPVLSANSSGAAVPNLSGFVTSSGGSAGGSGGSSARAQLKLAKANPINKVMETADHAIDAVSKLAEKQNSAKVVMQLHPERQAAADAGLNEMVQNIANFANNSSDSGSSSKPWYRTILGSMFGGPVSAALNIRDGFRNGTVNRNTVNTFGRLIGGVEGRAISALSNLFSR